jgi:hypothetical protein
MSGSGAVTAPALGAVRVRRPRGRQLRAGGPGPARGRGGMCGQFINTDELPDLCLPARRRFDLPCSPDVDPRQCGHPFPRTLSGSGV